MEQRGMHSTDDHSTRTTQGPPLIHLFIHSNLTVVVTLNNQQNYLTDNNFASHKFSRSLVQWYFMILLDPFIECSLFLPPSLSVPAKAISVHPSHRFATV
jgi:hypothetical protein